MKKKKAQRTVEKGRIYINATFNNTIVTVTDEMGAPLATGSTGQHGFTGTRKSTPYAATITADSVLKKITDFGFREATIFVKGIGPGREAALRVVRASRIDIEKIIDITPVPHNGIKAPKLRRV
jgi:small subunit ribosomal protein S11